jgi:C-terminal processing protease CtpA/Prc
MCYLCRVNIDYMIKHYQILLTYSLLILLMLVSSCGEDRWLEYKPQTEVNEWIDNVLRKNYLWVTSMPSESKVNYFDTQSAFLKSVLSSDDKVTHLDSVPNVKNTYGITASFYVSADNDTVYNAVITYVCSDSPAARAGLKRGDWIMKVGGNNITSSNKSTILVSGNATTVNLGEYTAITTDGTTSYKVISSGKVVNLEASGNASDHPVNYYTTLTVGTKKIGYLVYSSFNPGSNNEYDNELRKAFTSFKSDAVSDIILDLRYNKGGEISSAQLLATMLIPSEKMGSTFVKLIHNTEQSSMDTTYTFNKDLIGSGANLNLSRVYVITTSTTAQMSELLLAALVPYMNVYTIGGTTAGYMGVTKKFTTSGLPYEFNPVTSIGSNASDMTYSTSGITASTTSSDASDLKTLLSFGDQKETMLAATLALITK